MVVVPTSVSYIFYKSLRSLIGCYQSQNNKQTTNRQITRTATTSIFVTLLAVDDVFRPKDEPKFFEKYINPPFEVQPSNNNTHKNKTSSLNF